MTVSEPTPERTVVWPASLVTPLTVKFVTVRVSPSTSMSLVRTLPVATVSSATVFVSVTAIGASFTAVTVRFSVEVEDRLPSVIVTVMAGTLPFQLVAGVKVYLPSEPSVKEPAARVATVPAA